jgi:hypothetical protein
VVAQSFAGQSAMGQTGNAAIGNALGTFSDLATRFSQTSAGFLAEMFSTMSTFISWD